MPNVTWDGRSVTEEQQATHGRNKPVVILGFCGAALVLGWLVFITIVTMRTAGAEGAVSPAELATRASTALQQRDPDALADVLADPVTGDSEFAQHYLATLSSQGIAAIEVAPLGPGRAELRGTIITGRRFSIQALITVVDDRWYLDPTPVV